LSQNAVKKYYELRDAFRDNPANGKKYSTEQLERVWNCKGSFRKSLKEDVQLLFNEESEIQEDD
jgi:hypothetical protein